MLRSKKGASAQFGCLQVTRGCMDGREAPQLGAGAGGGRTATGPGEEDLRTPPCVFPRPRIILMIDTGCLSDLSSSSEADGGGREAKEVVMEELACLPGGWWQESHFPPLVLVPS